MVAFNIACGACWFCRRGQTQLCEHFRNLGAGVFGGSLGGAQAELVRIPAADVNLLSVPAAVDDEAALFVGDILTTGYYGASLAGAGADDVVAVVGAGPVGFFCVQAARALGAGRVVALDPEPSRLALAERAGAEAVDIRARHPSTVMAEATEGRGADVVIDAVGSAPAYESAIDLVRRGGRVVVLGVYAGESVELQLGVYWARALDVRFAGITPVHAWWVRAMEALVRGDLDPLPLISHRMPLEDAARGLRAVRAARGDEGHPGAVTDRPHARDHTAATPEVRFADPEPHGLAELLGGLIGRTWRGIRGVRGSCDLRWYRSRRRTPRSPSRSGSSPAASRSSDGWAEHAHLSVRPPRPSCWR